MNHDHLNSFFKVLLLLLSGVVLPVNADSLMSATDTEIAGSKVGSYYLQGYACSVVHNPDQQRLWAIHLYNFEESLTDYEVVFGLSKNRKIQSVACTPDGSLMLFSVKESVAGDYEIYELDLATQVLTRLTDNDTNDLDVSLSADGLTMAWQEVLADGRRAIALRTYTQTGGDFEQVSLASANPFLQPSLSANGDWLALIQQRENTYRALRYDTATADYLQVKLLHRNNGRKLLHPSVSDDGLTYGWLQGDSQPNYRVRSLSANTETIVIQGAEVIHHAKISPNGQWVAYSYAKEEGSGVRFMHLSSRQSLLLDDESAISTQYLGNDWMGDVEHEAPPAIVTGKLNDTGITQCADSSTVALSCPVVAYPDQDAEYGRDVTHNDDSDGHAGFSFTKLDADGNELLANATDWSCVKDNVTGLIWEVKQGGNSIAGDEGLYDVDDRYTWYNTEAYANRVNTERLCGASDWRLPAIDELLSLVRRDRVNPSIDTNYFPNIKQSDTEEIWYWSSSTTATNTICAWSVDYSDGQDGYYKQFKYDSKYVRLVRGRR